MKSQMICVWVSKEMEAMKEIADNQLICLADTDTFCFALFYVLKLSSSACSRALGLVDYTFVSNLQLGPVHIDAPDQFGAATHLWVGR